MPYTVITISWKSCVRVFFCCTFCSNLVEKLAFRKSHFEQKFTLSHNYIVVTGCVITYNKDIKKVKEMKMSKMLYIPKNILYFVSKTMK